MKKINETKNNKKANSTINKIFDEMKYAEEYLKNLNVTWYESYEDIYSMDIYYLYRLDHQKVKDLEKKYHNQYLLLDKDIDKRSGQPLKKINLYDEEDNIYTCEFGITKWNSYNKTERHITYKNNGDIKYTQLSSRKSTNKVDYEAIYNVENNDISINFKLDKDILKYTSNNSLQTITYNNITIETNLTTNTKRIIYQDKHQNKNIYYEIIIESNKITKKYLKLTNYNLNNEIDNTLEFTYDKDNLLNATYIKDNQEVNMLENEVMSNFINTLLEKTYSNNQILNNLKNNHEELINIVKDNLFIIIKQIKGDVPLKGLSKRLDIALSMIYTKNENNKEQNKDTKRKNKSKNK